MSPLLHCKIRSSNLFILVVVFHNLSTSSMVLTRVTLHWFKMLPMTTKLVVLGFGTKLKQNIGLIKTVKTAENNNTTIKVGVRRAFKTVLGKYNFQCICMFCTAISYPGKTAVGCVVVCPTAPGCKLIGIIGPKSPRLHFQLELPHQDFLSDEAFKEVKFDKQ